MIAKHVMNIHMNRPNQNADDNGETVGEIDIDKMKRYIAYCKRSGIVPVPSRCSS
jgi:DNA replication licensing factor MCM5